MLKQIHPFAISFALGLLIGIDRERSHPEGTQPMGVRTFVLLGLLGTLAAEIGEPLLTVSLTAFILGTIIIGYLRSTRSPLKPRDIGLTTELSAASVYAIGYLAFHDALLAAVIGVIILLVLVSRVWIHPFVRKTLRPGEINAAITLLAFVVLVVPFLPNRTIDPWDLVNPRRFALLAAVIAGMEFAGYAATRAFGHGRGMMLTGLLGGLVSSTAVFAIFSRRVKTHPDLARPASAAAILATVATLLELLVILFSASLSLGNALVIPLLVMILTGLAWGWRIGTKGPRDVPTFVPTSPLDLRSVAKLFGIIAGMLLLVAVVDRNFGVRATQMVSFIAGLFELQGISLATATLQLQGKLTLQDACLGIALAVLGSFLSKLALLWGIERKILARRVSLALGGMLIAGGAVYWWSR